MGEEEKKLEEKKVEETKPEESKKPEEEKKEEEKTEKPKEEKKTEESKDPPPPPPGEIVLRVYMHCEGCARKVRRSLKGFEGVEDVQTDLKTHKVIVKGKQADPLKVFERVQRKSHKQVELLTPIPKSPIVDEKKTQDNKENIKPEEKEKLPVIIVVLKVYMHCEGCAHEIQKRILRMKGVESVDPDMKNSQVTVKGIFDPQTLVQYVYKKTGKQAVIVKQEAEKKEEKGKEEKKSDGGEKEEKSGGEMKEKKGEEAKPEATEVPKLVEVNKNEFYYYLPVYPSRYFVDTSYPPQLFSDENPNACSIM